MTEGEVLAQANAWLAAGRQVALATVVRTWGSSPRPAGSQLAVRDDGAFVGSVSGGCVEGAVVTGAGEVLRTGSQQVLDFGVSNDRAWEVGLACGGRIAVLVRVATAEALTSACAALTARRPHEEWLELGGGERFRLRVEPPVRLLVIGAVHLAQPLVAMAPHVGLEPVVVDPRPAFATAQRFPGTVLVHAWPAEALRELGLDPHTAVLALTHDPKLDDPALEAALRSEVFYVGALGSRKTQAARRERLQAAGFGEADLSRIHGPIGLDLGAITPGEIAVEVLAQVVAAWRRPVPAA